MGVAAPTGKIRDSVYAHLVTLVPDVQCWPDALDQSTAFPAVMYSFEGIKDDYVMGSPGEGPKKVRSTGYLHVHSFDFSKPDSVRRATAIRDTLNGKVGPMGTVRIISSFKLVDMSDAEAPAPDGSGRVLYDTMVILSLGWVE